ncbi:Integrase catalytic domain-containing protein [Citrus sinensis]|uniref:Integrase catalytic domain-containing protein n=1 Tax=Citrus sinensis TaxID=2711 RepID=A0ACB8NVX0_CITSI|nr:Integrase catalytic domain-containing protein [Citrus sinensis]
MATNKERIERVEAEIRGLQDKMNQIELGLMDKLHHLEEVFSKLPDSISTSRGTTKESERNRQQLPSHVAKLEFPRYAGDDPTEWFNRVLQFFDYQKTMDDQKVALASFYFEECEDFDEALSHVKQTGTLRNYQKKFERLGNRVHGWTQKALVGAFMGGLKPEISEEIWIEVEIDENTNEEPTGGVNQTDLDESKDLQITYYVLTGSAAPQTMHVLAKIGSYEIMVLINNRSTHNFISTRLANQLQLPIKPTTTFFVQVVNSEKLTCQGKLEKELEYLGHIVTCNNMKMDERKVAAMVSWPKPQNITELRGFLGLTGYYRKFVKGCETCERVKATTLKPAGLLQSLPIPFQLWDDISIDFIEGLPSSQGKDAIIVVVDRLSKSTHFISLTHPFTAKTVAEKFIDGVVKLHGMPKSILSDRDPIFVSKFWQEFFTLSGTHLKMSSAYHPQTDGETEVVNRCLEQYLRCFAHQWPRKWSFYLAWAEFWYNTTYHVSASMTPFQAQHGRLPPTVPNYQVGTSPMHEVDKALLSRDELLSQLKRNLAAAANRMKQSANKGRRDVEFKEGDMSSVFKGTHQKLANRYFGPYKILHKVGTVAYKLQLPEGAKIHHVFHVSLLKKVMGESTTATVELSPIDDKGVIMLQPESIVDTH